MKTFNRVAAQGEAYIMRLNPGTIENIKTRATLPERSDVHIIAHSETGHHHVMDRAKVEVREPVHMDKDSAVGILYLIVKEPTSLDHLRPYDTHESIMFEPGEYKITLQQEYTPEGYRRVAD
jgi:hypothetical protein